MMAVIKYSPAIRRHTEIKIISPEQIFELDRKEKKVILTIYKWAA